jgi:hypothetical protein
MDLGGSARTRQTGSPWLAVALILAVAFATIGAAWFASSVGRAAGTAQPESVTYVNRYGQQPVTYVNRYGRPNAGDRSYDQIEAQRGIVAPSSTHWVAPGAYRRVHAPSGSDRIEHLRKAGAAANRDRVGGP